MNRRDLIAGLMLAATRRRAQAQPSAKHYRIAIIGQGYLPPTLDEANRPEHWLWKPWFADMGRLGYVEGQNLTIERYWGGMVGRDYSPDLARKVVASNPDLIFALSVFVAHDLMTVTDTIPIVAWMVAPVRYGLVSNLAHPGGNLTGVDFSASGFALWGKRLQLLHEIAHNVSKVGYLTLRALWESTILQWGKPHPVEKVAKELGLDIVGPFLEKPVTESEVRRVLAAMSSERVDAIYVNDPPEISVQAPLVIQLLQEYRLPAIYPYRYWAQIGGLIAYGVDASEISRVTADQIDKILKGAKPGNIPIYSVEKYSLAINLKTATALGLTVPSSLLAQADELIE